jgi:hypothetical protein
MKRTSGRAGKQITVAEPGHSISNCVAVILDRKPWSGLVAGFHVVTLSVWFASYKPRAVDAAFLGWKCPAVVDNGETHHMRMMDCSMEGG